MFRRITYLKVFFLFVFFFPDQCVGEQEQQPLLILPEAVLVLCEGRCTLTVVSSECNLPEGRDEAFCIMSFSTSVE